MLLRRFLADRKGSLLPTFGIALVPLFGLVGAAVDYSNANAARSAMQAAADATALSLAKEARLLSTDALSQKANAYFSAEFGRAKVTVGTLSASYTPATSSVSVAVNGTVAPTFMQLFKQANMAIGARAVARVPDDGLGCVVSLAGTGSSTASVQGTADIQLNNCSLYDDSSDSSALAVGGSGTVSALSVNVVGNISGKTSITTTQGISTGVPPIPDPYADVSYPAFSSCTDVNLTVKNAMTIDPGVYCQGIGVNAGATLTMNPGIYYIDRGTFTVNGGASVNGTGVTIVFTSSTGMNYASASFNGGATINLTAPKTGPTAGIVMFGDRKMPAGTAFKFEGGAAQQLTGAIYTPQAAVTFAGGANTTNGCTKLIGNTVKFTGNSNFAINCAGYGTRPIGSISARLLQ